MKYPILAKVMQAPGKGGKMTNRAFNASTGEDITRDIVYVTLKSALDKGMYLYKDNENSSWTQVDSNSTLRRQKTRHINPRGSQLEVYLS